MAKGNVFRKSFGRTVDHHFRRIEWYDRGDTTFIMVKDGENCVAGGMTHRFGVLATHNRRHENIDPAARITLPVLSKKFEI